MIKTATRCSEHPKLFQDPLLEDATGSLTFAGRRLQAMLTAEAIALCAQCPARRQCLYDAVVRFDLAGVAGGTTPSERAAIRQRLDWRVPPENLDNLLGLSPGGRINHDELLRTRRINPDQSLDQLAERLGCSLSTIKRHLRQERAPRRAKLHVVPPSQEQVLQAYRDVCNERRTTTESSKSTSVLAKAA